MKVLAIIITVLMFMTFGWYIYSDNRSEDYHINPIVNRYFDSEGKYFTRIDYR